ncbi:hypothetical protein XENOCAPTIV_019765 [Xenoophorus captivus]|uniref:Uncharacterized protein n=1 Tax=Xenoophorus captivus TaxID=1517983 RepID=A0ABV0S8D4_9TELE
METRERIVDLHGSCLSYSAISRWLKMPCLSVEVGVQSYTRINNPGMSGHLTVQEGHGVSVPTSKQKTKDLEKMTARSCGLIKLKSKCLVTLTTVTFGGKMEKLADPGTPVQL